MWAKVCNHAKITPPSLLYRLCRCPNQPGVRNLIIYSIKIPANKAACSLASHTLQSQEKEGLITSRTSSCTCSRILGRPIRLQLFSVTIVTRPRNNGALSLNIAHLVYCQYNNRQARAAQYKLYVTSRKMYGLLLHSSRTTPEEV
jgi:hypothetical protein